MSSSLNLFIPFLVADTRLYTLPCRSVGRSVRPSVRPSVTFLNSEQFSLYCSHPTVRDWIAVYPALFSLRVDFRPDRADFRPERAILFRQSGEGGRGRLGRSSNAKTTRN